MSRRPPGAEKPADEATATEPQPDRPLVQRPE
jgi:hypothetical protein